MKKGAFILGIERTELKDVVHVSVMSIRFEVGQALFPSCPCLHASTNPLVPSVLSAVAPRRDEIYSRPLTLPMDTHTIHASHFDKEHLLCPCHLLVFFSTPLLFSTLLSLPLSLITTFSFSLYILVHQHGHMQSLIQRRQVLAPSPSHSLHTLSHFTRLCCCSLTK